MVEIYCSVSIRKERWDGGAGTVYIYMPKGKLKILSAYVFTHSGVNISRNADRWESIMLFKPNQRALNHITGLRFQMLFYARSVSMLAGWLIVVIAAVFLEPMMISFPLIGANIFKFNSHLNIRIQGTDEWISNVFQQFTSRKKYFQLLANVKTSQRSVILLMLSYSMSFFFLFFSLVESFVLLFGKWNAISCKQMLLTQKNDISKQENITWSAMHVIFTT